MAATKPPEVNTCTAADCVTVSPGKEHWNDLHMPCSICDRDIRDQRNELLFNKFCKAYFHISCITARTATITSLAWRERLSSVVN